MLRYFVFPIIKYWVTDPPGGNVLLGKPTLRRPFVKLSSYLSQAQIKISLFNSVQ